MRQFVENIGKEIESKGRIVACEVFCNYCVEIREFHLNLQYYNHYDLLVLELFSKRQSIIKLYEDEYDYLYSIICKLKQKQEDEFITLFTNLNDNN